MTGYLYVSGEYESILIHNFIKVWLLKVFICMHQFDVMYIARLTDVGSSKVEGYILTIAEHPSNSKAKTVCTQTKTCFFQIYLIWNSYKNSFMFKYGTAGNYNVFPLSLTKSTLRRIRVLCEQSWKWKSVYCWQDSLWGLKARCFNLSIWPSLTDSWTNPHSRKFIPLYSSHIDIRSHTELRVYSSLHLYIMK